MACAPPRVISSRLPSASSVEPDTVPEPSRSAVSSAQPLLVWCATICATVQYSVAVSERDRRCAAKPRSRMRAVLSSASSWIDRPPRAWSQGLNRWGIGDGSPVGRTAAAVR